MVILSKLIKDESSDASLRLFMDYNGLKIMWRWMTDVDEKPINSDISFKIKVCLYILIYQF